MLVVLPDFPYPPVHGGRVDMWGQLCHLSRAGHAIHLVVTVKQQPEPEAVPVVASKVARLSIVHRSYGPRALVSREPFQMASRAGLREIALEASYDVVLLSSEFVAPVLANPALHCRRIALRVHNDEASFARQVAESETNPFRKLFFGRESRRLERASAAVFARAGQLWFISRDYHRQWVAERPGAAGRAAWLPPSLDLEGFRRVALEGRQVLFVGNLRAPTNLEGLRWYLDQVHPRLRHLEGYRFVVAGALLGKDLPVWLRAAGPEVEVHTDAADLGVYYRRSAVFVNPMQRGASLKLKTVNAVENGLPVVTTTVGNEGTGFEDGTHVLERNSPQDFAAAIEELLITAGRRQELVAAAQGFLSTRYDHGRDLERLLDKLLKTED